MCFLLMNNFIVNLSCVWTWKYISWLLCRFHWRDNPGIVVHDDFISKEQYDMQALT